MQNRDSNWRHFLGDRCRIVRCDPVPGRIFTSERLLWALAVVIGIELLVSQVISWEVSVWVAMCGDGLLALGTLGLFLARIYRNREVDWLLLFVAVMMLTEIRFSMYRVRRNWMADLCWMLLLENISVCAMERALVSI